MKKFKKFKNNMHLWIQKKLNLIKNKKKLGVNLKLKEKII